MSRITVFDGAVITIQRVVNNPPGPTWGAYAIAARNWKGVLPCRGSAHLDTGPRLAEHQPSDAIDRLQTLESADPLAAQITRTYAAEDRPGPGRRAD